ncbi:MAG TPA: sigma-54-dependent Fis family transcriptional regulator [Gammaproteobacteria bacterium]|nr:sigma-54-dependent Fis family transcriptional regulator [Gammaproteobacteria bacterium]
MNHVVKHSEAEYSPDVNHFKRSSVLIVDDEPGIRRFLQKGLAPYFGLVEVAEDTESAETIRQRCHFDLIISDIRLPDKSGVDWVADIRQQGGTTSVIFITAHANLEMAIAALQAGASDFIMKPFRMQQMLASIQHVLAQQQIQRENVVLKRQVEQIYDSGMIGDCDTMKAVCTTLQQVAPMPTTVLIEGESGTGKELAARALHRWSGRKGSFVPINCGAISGELMESELFGHTKGAFTGAQQTREGLFTFADGGTLFLDEIGEMPLSMQVHLLRVLEEKVIRPVGANREIPVNVRIIAATNRHLHDAVEKGRFREDLFYRLNVVTVRLPALRERMGDLSALVSHFATTIAADLGVSLPVITGEDLFHLRAYGWPGNVRELRNVIERCLLLKKGPQQCINTQASVIDNDHSEVNDESLACVEKTHIMKILAAEKGNKSAAARRLKVSRKTLERKVKQWNDAE